MTNKKEEIFENDQIYPPKPGDSPFKNQIISLTNQIIAAINLQ